MKILYICTHNRCRSILSEAITNHFASDEVETQNRIEAKSAGSQPSGEVHPLSLKYLQEAGIATDGLKSQSWDEFEDFAPDVVVTVCDSAAGESCPVWFGNSIKIHWGLTDPSKMAESAHSEKESSEKESSEEEIAQAFQNTIEEIKQRVLALKEIAHIKEPEALRKELNKLI